MDTNQIISVDLSPRDAIRLLRALGELEPAHVVTVVPSHADEALEFTVSVDGELTAHVLSLSPDGSGWRIRSALPV